MSKKANKNHISRAANKIYTQFIQTVYQKQFVSSKHQSLRYMFFKNRSSNVLIIGFQACYDKGAIYNYVSTLKDFHANRLFIKDDFCSNHVGNYYLGCSGSFSVEEAVFELINKYISETAAEKLIFIGSSKGAYAALNFGLRYPCSDIIIAAPQYFIGDYLDCAKWHENLADILGNEITQDNKDILNNRLKGIIRNDAFADTQHVYVQYSVNEHTYPEHIRYLLDDLHNCRINVEENIKHYTVHGDLKYCFPSYLKEKISMLLDNYNKTKI